VRFLLCLPLFLIAGLPLNEPLHAGAALLAAIALWTGVRRHGKIRLLLIGGVLAMACLLHLTWPHTNIPEGHNLFIVKQDGEPLSRLLPVPVYQAMATDFRTAYPTRQRCEATVYGCWQSQAVPAKAYAFSFTGIWRGTSLSRHVSDIDFQSAEELGAGFMNDLGYNWYKADSEIKRENPPYFVTYILPHALVDSRLCWRGKVFWQDNNNAYTLINHTTMACRDIVASDVGQQIFAYSFTPDTTLAIKLEKSPRQILFDLLYDALRIFLIGALVFCTVRVNWRGMLFPATCMAAMIALVTIRAPDLVWHAPIFAGGDDGLTHQSFARSMTQDLLSGDWLGFLRGVESVFYMMPGMRYVLSVNGLLFGDKLFGIVLALALLPLLISKTVTTLTNQTIARVVAASFIALGFLPDSSLTQLIGNFGSYAGDYIHWAHLGFPEIFGYVFFLAGLYKILHGLESRRFDQFVLAGLALAAAIFMRPNLAIAGAALLSGTTLLLFTQRQFRNLLALGAAFSPILLMPLHNIWFGEKFVLLTSAATISANLFVQPEAYLLAIKTGLGLANDPKAVSQSVWHVREFLASSNMAHRDLGSLIRLGLLIGLAPALLLPSSKHRLLAFTCLGLLLPLFFYNPTGRYVLLAWLLTTVASIAAFYQLVNKAKTTPTTAR
jgi:hypothetical protein